MFTEWELIGIPLRITIGPKSIESGKVELYDRVIKSKLNYDISRIVQIILERLN